MTTITAVASVRSDTAIMAASRRVRIADVAAHAGVGAGTVSRVLNRSPQVSDSTRRRVLQAIEAIRYRPSRLAADLSRGTPRSVAILVPFLTRPSVVARLAGVIEALDLDGRSGGLGFCSTSDRFRGYRRAMTRAGLPVDPGLVRRGRHGSAGAAEMAAGLLRQADRPAAIFAASDTQAGGVLSAADATGLLVPGDLSVIGFDDIDTAARWIVRGSTTAACGRRTADRAGPAQPEPAGSRSRLSLTRVL